MYSGSLADSRACCMAGKYKKINIAIIAIATNNSTRVKSGNLSEVIIADVSFHKIPCTQYN